MNTSDITPVEVHGDFLAKRDDLFKIAGIRGGKVRSCWTLLQRAKGATTASSRHSPQMQIVARLSRKLGIACNIHCPSSKVYTPEMLDAVEHGATIYQYKPGYNSVIIARAKADAQKSGYCYVPFGMECKEAVRANAAQAMALPGQLQALGVAPPKRIVVCVGSGITAAGILQGLAQTTLHCRVLGVQVGANPHKRLGGWAPFDWARRIDLVHAIQDYHQTVKATWCGIVLDPHYEAKVVPFLQPGDLFWIVGIRAGI